MIVRGEIDEVRFRNEENGYTILVLDCEGEPLVCVGTFPPVSEGEFVQLGGDFTVHPKFGKQFKVTEVHAAAPDTLDGIVRYLGSGLIRGIGPKTALSIVEKFGKATFDVITHNPARLAEVKGVTKKNAAGHGIFAGARHSLGHVAQNLQAVRRRNGIRAFRQSVPTGGGSGRDRLYHRR